MALFLIVAAALSIFAFNSRSDALSNFNRAEAQRLADESNNIRTQHLSSEVAALLAIRSMWLQYTVDGDEALANADLLDLPVQIFTGNTDIVNEVAYSPDGKMLLSASSDGTARLWDVQTGTQLRSFPANGGSTSVAFSPDGRYLAVGGATTTLWSTQTDEPVHQLVDAENLIFSPDGHYLLTSSQDKTAHLWDVQTGQEIQRYVGHTDAIYGAIAFSADGQRVFTGSYDHTVRVWDTFSGQEQGRLTVDDKVFALALSPDGQEVLVGGSNGMLQLWD